MEVVAVLFILNLKKMWYRNGLKYGTVCTTDHSLVNIIDVDPRENRGVMGG